MNTMSAQTRFEKHLSEELGCEIKAGQSLKVEPAKLNNGEEANDLTSIRAWLAERLAEKPVGWVQFSDINVWIQEGSLCRSHKARKELGNGDAPQLDELEVLEATPTGVPLAAELATPDASFHLRHNGTGWIAAKITKDKSAPSGSVIEARTFRHSIRSLPELAYEVAWTGCPLRPTAFRLIASRIP